MGQVAEGLRVGGRMPWGTWPEALCEQEKKPWGRPRRPRGCRVVVGDLRSYSCGSVWGDGALSRQHPEQAEDVVGAM